MASLSACFRLDAIRDGTFANLSNTRINRSNPCLGLFNIVGRGGVIAGLELVDVDITSLSSTATALAGALAGYIGGTARASYGSGEISQTSESALIHGLGGLAGQLSSETVEAGWSSVNVSANLRNADIGGLAGRSLFSSITDGCSVGAVSASNGGDAGGLVGNFSVGTITASCAAGLVSAMGTGSTVTATYWDTNVAGADDDSDTDMPLRARRLRRGLPPASPWAATRRRRRRKPASARSPRLRRRAVSR